MAMATTKRIAAELLGAGVSRVRIKPGEDKAAGEAMTRDDVRSLISKHSVYALQANYVSRWRARKKLRQKQKGRRRGIGSRKGGKFSKIGRKEQWMSRVRAQRGLLAGLLGQKKITHEAYRRAYKMIKGGAFKGRGSMLTHLKDSGMLKQ